MGAGLFQFTMALALEKEMNDFPGGPRALAATIGPSAEAMRIMRWPAERLDTVGGYLTYHNVILLNLAFAVYGAVLGARAVRGAEEGHAAEELLATGVSRTALVRARAIGFAATALMISLAVGAATAAGLAVAGVPDAPGALVTLLTSGLVAVVGFALALAVSQLLPGSRSAAGLTSAALVGLYIVTNLEGELGALSGLRWLSPFHYANLSRALVPGHGLDLLGTLVLLAMAAGLLWVGAVGFERRDYAAALWVRHRDNQGPAEHATRVPTRLLGSVWTASLRRGALGLLAWAAGGAALTGIFAALQPAVVDVWTGLDYLTALLGGANADVEDLYWAFLGEMLAPLIAAFVIVRASGWVADLAQGRVEMLLTTPVSWSRLVVERTVALVVGVLVITVTAIISLVVIGLGVGSSFDARGLVRLTVTCLLFGAALGGVAALVVAWVRRAAAVTTLAAVVAASYLLTLLTALFGWPEWLNRLSVFWAFGHPYLEWPPTSAVVVLLTAGLAGTALAARVAERTPKVA
ncbi:MAG: ABC transporter permease subunit [Nocardioides sp.]